MTGLRIVGVLVAVVVGMALATQARINGELSARIDDPVATALLSFLGGELILLVLVLVVPRMRRGLLRVVQSVRGGELPGRYLLGGVCGAYLVVCQGLTVGAIGVALFTVAVVAGQAASSLVVDRAGIGPGDAHPVSVTRVLGAVLTMGAVILAVSDRFGTPSALGLAALPVLAGVAVAWQQAVNGRVGAAAGRAGGSVGGSLSATLVNFTVGSMALGAAAVVVVLIRGLPEPLPAAPLLYLGGPLGILFIATAAAVVPVTGVLLLGLGTVAGQPTGALLLDVFAPAAADRISVVTVAGTVLTLVAVAIAAVPARHRI